LTAAIIIIFLPLVLRSQGSLKIGYLCYIENTRLSHPAQSILNQLYS